MPITVFTFIEHKVQFWGMDIEQLKPQQFSLQPVY